MADGAPFTSDGQRPVCGICPSLLLPGGAFDVHERPSKRAPFDPVTGNRYTAGGVPVCVHPDRVGLPPAEYATSAVPLPWEAAPPTDPAQLGDWLRTALEAAPPDVCGEVIDQASAILAAADPAVDVTAVLRAALS
ncbi:hypothetical protein ACZ90_12685 [Streptomyces albus subsp. albus]|nr:hypothetical protein ACZ90_12685 [Streptomyces albus subsp. albus]